MKKLELLSPAKNLDFGREAINHGADAVYIGAPAYGARAAATNTLQDVEALVQYAHFYRARVFATVNTLLFDSELEPAVQMIRRLYEMGVDALIIQDFGLLECDLPPIELHASTQCHNVSVERVKFMQSVGFKRVILARETSLQEMAALRQQTSVELEAFVHGALCVSYSGQCYMSQFLTGRSGNRGCCSQPCRSRYDLLTTSGRTVLANKHLLSLRDFNAAEHLQQMADAGITSFKIEGRLKDLSYVKNITAYYRQQLDALQGDYCRASAGRVEIGFVPDPERTFHRRYTDYFLLRRQPMASFETAKAVGKEVGCVERVGDKTLQVRSREPLTAGDGLCFLDAKGELQGFLVNEVRGNVIMPNRMPIVQAGTRLYRNLDQTFEHLLRGKTATRTVGVEVVLRDDEDGLCVSIVDEDGLQVRQRVLPPAGEEVFPLAQNRERSRQLAETQLCKFGGTPFVAISVSDLTEGLYHLSSAALNAARRQAAESLQTLRQQHFRPVSVPLQAVEEAPPHPAELLDYRANIVNDRAEAFYRNHGFELGERGLEQTHDYAGHALMTTRYCLRYELGCCRLGKGSAAPKIDLQPTDELLLQNNGRRFSLRFDCQRCLMQVYAEE